MALSLGLEEVFDGLVDRLACDPAVEEDDGDEGEEDVGGPCCGEWAEVPGFSEGGEDGGAEDHAGAEEDGDGDSAADSTAGEDDAERGGEKDGDEADEGLGVAVVEVGLVGAAVRERVILVDF